MMYVFLFLLFILLVSSLVGRLFGSLGVIWDHLGDHGGSLGSLLGLPGGSKLAPKGGTSDLIEIGFEKSIWSGKYAGTIAFGCSHRRKMIGRVSTLVEFLSFFLVYNHTINYF